MMPDRAVLNMDPSLVGHLYFSVILKCVSKMHFSISVFSLQGTCNGGFQTIADKDQSVYLHSVMGTIHVFLDWKPRNHLKNTQLLSDCTDADLGLHCMFTIYI